MGKNEAAQLKAKGNAAFGKKDFKTAIEWYSKAIAEYDQDHTYFSNRSASYLQLGQRDEALSDAQKCVNLKPDWMKGHYRMGQALFELGRFADALAAYNAALRLDPQSSDLRQCQRKCEEEIRKAKEAGIDTSKMSPAELFKHKGNVSFKAALYDEAIEHYTKALELAPPEDTKFRAACHNNRAACHATSHRYKEVVKDCTKVLQLEKDNIKALLRRGLAYEPLEKYNEAMEDMQRVLYLAPQTEAAMNATSRLRRLIRQQNEFKATEGKI